MENKLKKLVDYEISIPEFLKRLQCSEANEHENVSLSCTVIGDPIPEISWFKEDGTQIVPDSHYEIKYNNETGVAELLVNDACIPDEQSYKCVASNKYGNAKTIGVIVVKGLFVFFKFYFESLIFLCIAARSASKNSSPSRTLAPPVDPVKRNVSPLRNIEVPPSNLLPVKEETEVSSHSDADVIAKMKGDEAKKLAEVIMQMRLLLFIINR